MKKILAGALTAAVVLTAGGAVWAAGGRGTGWRYVDANGDGVCDNQGTGYCWVDENNDGICDHQGCLLYTSSQEIKQSCFRLIRAAVMANNLTVVKKRLEWLDEADAEKTLLLVRCGVARTQKYITEKKVHELQTKLNELGRIIGGLQKHFINNR